MVRASQSMLKLQAFARFHEFLLVEVRFYVLESFGVNLVYCNVDMQMIRVDMNGADALMFGIADSCDKFIFDLVKYFERGLFARRKAEYQMICFICLRARVCGLRGFYQCSGGSRIIRMTVCYPNATYLFPPVVCLAAKNIICGALPASRINSAFCCDHVAHKPRHSWLCRFRRYALGYHLLRGFRYLSGSNPSFPSFSAVSTCFM